MRDSDDGAISKGGTNDTLDKGIGFCIDAVSTLALTVLDGDDVGLEYVPARSFVENNDLAVH